MSAGYQTLHVGKNGALALAAITGWQVFMPLVPLWSMLIASELVKCCMVWLWHSGAPYAFAVLRFFLREKTFFIDCNFVTWTVECFYHHSSYSE